MMTNFFNNPALFWTALAAFFIALFVELALRVNRRRRKRVLNAHSSRMEKALARFRAEKTKRITNDEYQKITGVSDATATRDLQKLENLGVLKQRGKGRGAYYIFQKKTTQK